MKIERISVYNPANLGFFDKSDTIKKSLDELACVKFDPNDIIYLNSFGVYPPFKNGEEAIACLKNKNVTIKFLKMENPDIHARWHSGANSVYINENYKNKRDFADILAISEAIFHEAGHIKDSDLENSIQEELDCLALNSLAHRYYERKYPNIFKNKNDFLYSEGVSLYEKLFFDFDTTKTALKKRVEDKYGELNAGSILHPASFLAAQIKKSGANI